MESVGWFFHGRYNVVMHWIFSTLGCWWSHIRWIVLWSTGTLSVVVFFTYRENYSIFFDSFRNQEGMLVWSTLCCLHHFSDISLNFLDFFFVVVHKRDITMGSTILFIVDSSRCIDFVCKVGYSLDHTNYCKSCLLWDYFCICVL